MCTVKKQTVSAVWKQDFHVRWDLHGSDHGSAQNANAIPCECSLLVKGCSDLPVSRTADLAVFSCCRRHWLYVQARGSCRLHVEPRRRRMPGAALNLQSVDFLTPNLNCAMRKRNTARMHRSFLLTMVREVTAIGGLDDRSKCRKVSLFFYLDLSIVHGLVVFSCLQKNAANLPHAQRRVPCWIGHPRNNQKFGGSFLCVCENVTREQRQRVSHSSII